MSVQNGERLATKQDLADMYSGLLPYLGGMPEVLANKFSKGDLYDTSEKMIGKWINGKPLYKRTWSVDLALQGGGKEFSYTLSDIANMDMVYLLDSCAMPDGDASYNILFVGRLYAGMVNKSNNTVRFGQIATNTDNLYHTKWFTLMYTKKTDSANSFNIGEATDYSTEEKIIGTWIGGSPVYQKTWTGLNLSIESNSWVNSGISNSGIEQVVSGYAYWDTYGIVYPVIVNPKATGQTTIQIAQTMTTTLTATRLTLQYTKSNS